ncbi:hypothetical protein AB0J72_55585 [Dactylosporangium sp. NPDC049742]
MAGLTRYAGPLAGALAGLAAAFLVMQQITTGALATQLRHAADQVATLT